MKDVSQITCLFYDHGFFLPLARKLAQTYKRVLYCSPWEKAFPVLNEGVIGYGFNDVERCNDFWPLKNEIDLFIFPDIYHQGLQAELRSQGFPVWGAGDGMKLEISRKFFLEKLEELGLDIPPYEEIVGVSNLAAYLKDKEDIWIKMSRWRGSWETKHWRNWKQDSHKLDSWAVKFGGIKEHVCFLCFPKIETNLEIGADTFCVDGQWPKLMLHGIEKKDEAYLSAVTKKTDMPEELTHVMDAFSPYLKEVGFRCQWSMEVRVGDKGNFFIDATTRGGLPSTASQMELWKNLPEIFWYGAHGELVEPIPAAKFSAECMVKMNGEQGAWETIILPDELKPFLKVSDCCEVDGQIWFPSDDGAIEEIGWLVATGDTPTETAKRMNELADLLPDGADAAVESLADIIREVEEEEESGIKFTDAPMPNPEIVLEESK